MYQIPHNMEKEHSLQLQTQHRALSPSAAGGGTLAARLVRGPANVCAAPFSPPLWALGLSKGWGFCAPLRGGLMG